MACMRQSFQSGVILDGRYQSLAYIHAGSFGMVFKARDLRTDQIVAIKCLTKRSAADDVHVDFAIDNFEELTLHERLGRHPNIVNLITSFETDAHLYLVLEFCERGDLYEAIYHNTGPVETEKVRRIMLELIDAVEYIHSKGVYHRDIKPENIFLTKDGIVKLGDFGLGTTDELSYENAVGSDRYMAPEQSESDGAGYSPAKADIWAIGICLLNILFKKNPFLKPTVEDMFFRDFCSDSRSLFDIFDDMSEDTFEVIQNCLNLNPTKRCLSAVRRAILRVDSFTTTDDDEDVFLSGSPCARPTANREPLGTPAIQSPMMDQDVWGDNPLWAKTYHIESTPPQPIRNSKLSMVHDAGSYSEDLFAKSAESVDWCSADTAKSQSFSSTLDYTMESSGIASDFTLTLPERHCNKFTSSASAAVGSLPVNMTKSKSKPIPSLSMIFGSQRDGPKSWSDMIEEDEELESELYRSLNALKENNARTFSHESMNGDIAIKVEDHHNVDSLVASTATKESTAESVVNKVSDKDDMVDGLFMYEPPSPKRDAPKPAQTQFSRYHVPARQIPSTVDKWTALGERRRAFTETPEKKRARMQQPYPVTPAAPLLFPRSRRQSPSTTISNFPALQSEPLDLNPTRRTLGLGQSHHSLRTAYVDPSPAQYSHLNNFTRGRDYRTGQSKETCSWTRRNDLVTLQREGTRGHCRESNWRRERRQYFGNAEWVGACVEARS